MNAVYGLFVLHLSFSVMAADIKCYVELDNGQTVVLQVRTFASSPRQHDQ